jgi:hypothetical protein
MVFGKIDKLEFSLNSSTLTHKVKLGHRNKILLQEDLPAQNLTRVVNIVFGAKRLKSHACFVLEFVLSLNYNSTQ